jgi:mycothiol synthase
MDAGLGDVRALTPSDTDAVVELVRICDLAESDDIDEDLIDWLRSAPPDEHRAFGRDRLDGHGGLATFGWIECRAGSTGLDGDLRVRPGLDPRVAGPVLERLRAEAASYDATKPLHLFVNRGSAATRRWLESLGGREVRRFWRMVVDLDSSVSPPPAVPGLVVRTVRDDEADRRTVWRVVEDSFADHFGHEDGRGYEEWLDGWLRRSGFDPTLWWAAELDGRVVAVLLGLLVAELGHVSTLGTLRNARGRGIGTTLLLTAFEAFHRRGLRRVSLGVDASNETGAVRLYESVGMRVVQEWVLYELASSGPSPAGSARSASKNV